MKKNNLLKRNWYFFVGLLLSLNTVAQEPEPSDMSNEYIKTVDNEYYRQVNPEAWRFHKYWFSKMNHNTGKVNVDIPIYNIVSGRISVPIQLVYNTQGIKVEDTPSVIGTGWDLIAGGRITRRIMGGIMDLYQKDHGPTESRTRGYQRKENYHNGSGNSIDQAPDLFSCSAPGLACRFFYSTNGVPFSLNEKNVKIEETVEEDMFFENYTGYYIMKSYHDEYDSFTITNESGVVYTFDKFEAGYSNSNALFTLQDNVTSWMLTKITDPLTGDYVNIEYLELDKVYNNARTDKSTYGISGCGCNTVSGSKTFSFTRWAKRISKISWSDGYVKFGYSQSREDHAQDIALKTVKVYNSDDQLIKDFELIQSYFTSTGGEDSYDNKRLKLDKVKEHAIDGSETLEYDLKYYPGTLPNRVSKEQDFWGYFNDNNATSLMPKLYFYPSMASSFSSSKREASNCFFPERLVNNGSQYYLINGADRSVNVNAQKIGMLKDIYLPTGGKKTLSYESNRIKFGQDEIKGGGLRVNSEILDDGDNSYEKIYEYENGEVLALPQMAHLCDPVSFYFENEVDRPQFLLNNLRVYSYSFLSSFDINPYEVVYRYVNEKQVGNGKIRYEFYPLKPYSDFVSWEITPYSGSGCTNMFSMYSNKHFSLPPRTSLSGKPQYTRYYVEGKSEMVKFVQYNYWDISETLMIEDVDNRVGDMTVVNYTDIVNYRYHKSSIKEQVVEHYKREGINERTAYEYNDNDLLSAVVKEIGDGEFDVTELVYPSDLISRDQQGNNTQNYIVCETMDDKNINIPIFVQNYYNNPTEQITALKSFSLNLYKITSGNIRLWKSYGSTSKAKYPYSLKFNYNSDLNALTSSYFREKNEITSYSYGKPSEIYNHKSGVYSMMYWDNNNLAQPNIVAYNAKKTEIFYESFENEGSYPPSEQFNGVRIQGGYVGDYCLEPHFGNNWIVKPQGFDTAKKYRISFWAMGNGVITIHQGKSINISSGVWKYYTTTFTGESQLDIYADMQGFIDEIRIYPDDAKMITRESIPLVGVTSETDEKDVTSYFEYDQFWRLQSVKNDNKNILEHVEYNYGSAGPTSATYLNLSKYSMTFDALGYLSNFVNVFSDGPWTVTKPSWILMEVTSGEGDKSLEILVQPNRGTSERSGIITFSIPNKSVNIMVTQNGEGSGPGGLEPPQER